MAGRKGGIAHHDLMPRGVLLGKIADPKAEHGCHGNRGPQLADVIQLVLGVNAPQLFFLNGTERTGFAIGR